MLADLIILRKNAKPQIGALKNEIMKDLKKRMYFFVPYNISPIQQAIQAGHAALEYARLNSHTWLFKDFVTNHKTWIILNGGTTNSKLAEDGEGFEGSLNNIKNEIIQHNFKHRMDPAPNNLKPIEYADFYEPDLNDALTAICFIAEERVFNYEDYPDFDDWFCTQDFPDDTKEWKASYIAYSEGTRAIEFPAQYKHWTELMGGHANLFLRELLKDKKLA